MASNFTRPPRSPYLQQWERLDVVGSDIAEWAFSWLAAATNLPQLRRRSLIAPARNLAGWRALMNTSSLPHLEVLTAEYAQVEQMEARVIAKSSLFQ